MSPLTRIDMYMNTGLVAPEIDVYMNSGLVALESSYNFVIQVMILSLIQGLCISVLIPQFF